MATDARTGFRAPWNAHGDEQDAPARNEPSSAGGDPDEMPAHDRDPSGGAVLQAPVTRDGQVPAAATPGPTPTTSAGRQAQFLLELRRAMQQAAEAKREETLSGLQAETKVVVERVHSRSAEGAEVLRRRADEDVTAIREWSRAEMARIREETELRITARRTALEEQVEQHAAVIEQEIERIHRRVDAFETAMAGFFEQLFAEDDPVRFATMARSLPEPPAFDVDPRLDPTSPSWNPAEAPAETASGDAVAPGSADEAPAQAGGDVVDEDAPAVAPATAPEVGSRGLTADDAAAAEAEALALIDEAPADDEIVAIDDSTLAARLAGLVPMGGSPAGGATGTAVTTIVVTGLVSVSSIAGFKRQLSRAAGVQGVAVSSSPDGDFRFEVSHHTGADLAAVVPTLADFRPTITTAEQGTLFVAATEPDADR